MVVDSGNRWSRLGGRPDVYCPTTVHHQVWQDLLLLHLFMRRVGRNGGEQLPASRSERRHTPQMGKVWIHLYCVGNDCNRSRSVRYSGAIAAPRSVQRLGRYIFGRRAGDRSVSIPRQRIWCRMWCPLAFWMNFWGRWSKFKISPEKGKCIDCNICNQYCQMGIDIKSRALRGEPVPWLIHHALVVPNA